VIANLDQFDDL